MGREKTAEDIISSFVAGVRQAAKDYGMWERGHRILVAVSGGPDSVALLSALSRLVDEEDLSLAVAHFHHGLRPEAGAEAEFVRSLAAQMGLAFFLSRGDVAAEAERMGRGIEAAARRLRLEFLEQTAGQHGYHRVALGHTASDRAETVLINLLRGTGMWGLRGMAPVRLPFIRPLIRMTREDVLAYCRAAGLQYVVDSSNLESDRFLRNKVRNELLPLLEREYRAGAGRAIVRCAEAVEEELAWTEPLVQEALRECREASRGEVRLRQAALAEMPPGLAVRVLRAAVEEQFGPPTDWTSVHFSSIRQALCRGETGITVELPGGLEGRIEYGYLVIRPRLATALTIVERRLPVPGTVELPEIGMEITTRLAQRRHAGPIGPWRTILRVDLADALIVRGWRPGDRFRPAGMGGRSKKLQDFFVDEKIPKRERSAIPLVVHPREGIIWVVGKRTAEGVAPPADASGEVAVLEARPVARSGGVSEKEG
ncbi:MAG: tRNA lysidine(34) synthetase TilS [Armatimonadetes bacterium]|nr:tRNA lysidine(34) synthetase TilS [Armatimonadota bacterium]